MQIKGFCSVLHDEVLPEETDSSSLIIFPYNSSLNRARSCHKGKIYIFMKLDISHYRLSLIVGKPSLGEHQPEPCADAGVSLSSSLDKKTSAKPADM